MRSLFQLLARILVTPVFLWAGIHKILDPTRSMQSMAQHGMRWTGFFLAGAIVIETIVILALLFGFMTRWSAFFLALYLIPLTIIFHLHLSDPAQLNNFLKNLGLVGGLLMIAACGGGRIALDAFMKKKKP